MAWARDFCGRMQPYATGVYVNNLGARGPTASGPPTRPATTSGSSR